MPRRPVFLMLSVALLMLAACSDGPDDAPASAEEISTPFTEVVLENLNTSGDDVTMGLSESHGRYFEHLGHIAFEDSVILGYISHTRAREDGTFMIIDAPGTSAHLFSAAGEHLKALDPTECDPGVNWMPNSGAFLSDGRIVVANNDARSTIRFTADGTCDRFIDPQMHPADDIAPMPDGSFVTREESFDEHWLVVRDPEGTEVRTFGHSMEFVNLINRMHASNYLAVFPDGQLAIGQPNPSPILFETFAAEGRPLFDPPSFARPIEEDIRDTRGMTPDEMMEEFRSVFSSHTLIMSVFALSDESLMVVYRNGFREADDDDYMAIHVSDLDGRPLTPADVTFPARIGDANSRFFPIFARDNLIFTVRPAEELPDGDWGNPGLDVWRFTPPTGG